MIEKDLVVYDSWYLIIVSYNSDFVLSLLLVIAWFIFWKDGIISLFALKEGNSINTFTEIIF